MSPSVPDSAPEARRPRRFGTDGVRGTFGRPPLDEATVRGLASALAAELREGHTSTSATGTAEPRVVLGGDTRESTPTLCRWLAEELNARQVETTYLGVVPTPCVAFAARSQPFACGVAVSASHNPHPDNGIKLIDAGGFKWSPEAELRLEERLDAGDVPPAAPSGVEIELEPDRELVAAYLSSLSSSLDGERPLDGLSVALDVLADSGGD